MKRIIPYFKPFAMMLLAMVALLLVQAWAELSLPNYMSDIVNTGIQQGGIENAAPDVISKDGMKLMQSFMTDEEKSLVDASYMPYSKIGQYPKDYPQINTDTQNVLVKSTALAADQQTSLNTAFGTAAWTMINTMQTLNPGSQNVASSELANLDFSSAYSQLLPMLSQIPQQVITESHDKAAQMDVSMLDQTGVAYSKAFYNELGVDVGAYQQNYIASTGVLMLLLAGASGAAAIAVGYFASKTAAGVARNMRSDLFRKVEGFSLNEYNKFSTASLITRTTNDITQIQTFVSMGVRLLLFAPIMGIGGIFMAVQKSSSMAWVIALAVICILALIVGVFLVAMPKFKIMQKLIDKLNLVSRESLSGMLVIRAFGTQKHEEKRFANANDDLAKTQLFINKVMTLMMPIMMFIMNGVTLLIVWVGAAQIEQSALQVGDMMAYIQYAMIIIMSFLMISMIFIMVPRASVSAERIHEVLSVEPAIVDPKTPKAFEADKKGVVEFKNVHFKYEGAEEDVLCDISFTALPGQTTAFIGSTGSGKSTLVNLIPRFYDVTEGEVSVSGVDVREVKLHDLREHIGYVPQKGVLFSGTIASNLRYGKKDATDAEIEQSAEIAQAMDFISAKKEGFESAVSEGGSNVSGGQKQRLSIARALTKKSDVYIFDDSFSALDYRTDTQLRKALKPYTKQSTVLIVAQRVSTILHADQIIVLDEGRIVGKGTHEELMQNCPEYIEIAKSQLGSDAV